MGFFSSDHPHAKAWEEVNNAPEEHKSKFTHELIGGAAAFAAMKAYEEHQKKAGKPADHAKLKEIVAGFAGAEVDKLIETKGLNYVDREKAKHHAQKEAEAALRMKGEL